METSKRPWHISVGTDLQKPAGEQWPQQILDADGHIVATLPAYRQRPVRDDEARKQAWADARAIVATVNAWPTLVQPLRELCNSRDIIRYGALSRGKWKDMKELLESASLALDMFWSEFDGTRPPYYETSRGRITTQAKPE